MPVVSITMPTYNGAKYLQEAIDSILLQTFKDFEVIVIIDGSTDNTLSILKEIKDPRFKIVENVKNCGLPVSLNKGLELSQGLYWTWFSDDDIFLPDALKIMVEYLDKNKQDVSVRIDCFRIDSKGKILSIERESVVCFLCKTDIAIEIGKFRPQYMLVEDADFQVRLQHYAGKIHRIQTPYFKYRQHINSLSLTKIAKRQFVSTLLHYDLITKGIEKADLKELFFDRLKIAALYRGYEWMDKIVEFAKKNDLSFKHKLERTSYFIRPN